MHVGDGLRPKSLLQHLRPVGGEEGYDTQSVRLLCQLKESRPRGHELAAKPGLTTNAGYSAQGYESTRAAWLPEHAHTSAREVTI